MTALTCDVCGSNLSTDTDGADFVVCELCGARKVLEKAEPAESEPEPDNSATTPNSSDVPTETEKKADAPAGYV
ncbi:MAG: hypothetical protein LBB74_04675, partial [Chitinispirillales bacterium]|nr:hypothetical protein [Chitinispirillales bacterium]